MSLMTTVTKSVVKAAGRGARMTKKGTKLAKLQMELRLTLKKQQDLFKQIGQQVHLSEHESVMASESVRRLRQEIKTCEAKINKLTTDINRLKKIDACHYCQFIFEENVRNCPRCARPVRQD